MRVNIEFDIEVYDLDENAIQDLLADWTYPMRTSRRLHSESWSCKIRGI